MATELALLSLAILTLCLETVCFEPGSAVRIPMRRSTRDRAQGAGQRDRELRRDQTLAAARRRPRVP